MLEVRVTRIKDKVSIAEGNEAPVGQLLKEF
jgi:hypothetical protein